MHVPKTSSTAQFSTIVTLLWYWITVYNHYINIKSLHKIQIFLLPLTSLYTVVMVSQMPRRPRNFMQTNRFQKEQSLTNFQGSISNFLGIHRKKTISSQSFYLNVFNGLRNRNSFHRGLTTKLFHFKSLLLQSCIHLKYGKKEKNWLVNYEFICSGG